jgi:hypothetical protein
MSFVESFEETSKNQGISILFLDPSETNLQLLHHPSIIGGDWASPPKSLVAVLGFEIPFKPVQIVQKSVKEI